MNLFEINEANKVYPSEHALLIDPFKKIWERDASKSKEQAILDYSFIELYCSKRKSNPYASIADESERAKLVATAIGVKSGHSQFTGDRLVGECIAAYEELLSESSPTLKLYNSALKACNTVIEFNENVDLNERTDKGMPVYKPIDVINSLKNASEVMKNLVALKEKVDSELFEDSKTRGNKSVGDYED